MNTSLNLFCLLLLSLGSATLSGCGHSDDDLIYTTFKCARAASALDHDEQGSAAMQTVAPAMKRLATTINMDRYLMDRTDRFHQDVPLERYGTGGQRQALVELYQSRECQALYKTASIKTSAITLPFVGKRYFNFFGGTGTGNVITITANGETQLQGCGDLGAGGSCEVLYSGPYQNPIPGDNGTSWFIRGEQVALRQNGDIENACGMDGTQPCVTELESP